MNKEQLVAENALLQSQIKQIEERDKTMRQVFAKVLGKVEHIQEHSWSTPKIIIEDCSWWEIAFLIGELKADADFSCVLEQRNQLQEENRQLGDELFLLKNPDKKC